MWYLAILGEDLATYAFWNLAMVTNPAICQDKLVNKQCAAHSGSPQDDELSITPLGKGSMQHSKWQKLNLWHVSASATHWPRWQRRLKCDVLLDSELAIGQTNCPSIFTFGQPFIILGGHFSMLASHTLEGINLNVFVTPNGSWRYSEVELDAA